MCRRMFELYASVRGERSHGERPAQLILTDSANTPHIVRHENRLSNADRANCAVNRG